MVYSCDRSHSGSRLRWLAPGRATPRPSLDSHEWKRAHNLLFDLGAPFIDLVNRNVRRAANKSFEISKFKFKFPIARTFELFRAHSRLYRSQILQVNSTKYSLESSRRDLHNALLCTALESIIENWGKKDRSLISKFSLKIAEFFTVFFQNFTNFAKILLNFRQI